MNQIIGTLIILVFVLPLSAADKTKNTDEVVKEMTNKSLELCDDLYAKLLTEIEPKRLPRLFEENATDECVRQINGPYVECMLGAAEKYPVGSAPDNVRMEKFGVFIKQCQKELFQKTLKSLKEKAKAGLFE